MDLSAEKFVENLLSGEAHQLPSDSVKVEDLEMKLPEWFDEKKYNQGRRFYKDYFFMMSASMILGVMAVFSIPSILKVLVGSRRSSLKWLYRWVPLLPSKSTFLNFLDERRDLARGRLRSVEGNVQAKRLWEELYNILNTMGGCTKTIQQCQKVPSVFSSVYTAYKRYFSTHLHVNAWFDHELKPGSVAWQSLRVVRGRHIQAGRAAKLKGIGIVSQRDMAFTLFGFIGFSFLKPDKFSCRQLEEGDWDAYNHCWKVLGHMIGLDDRYNICRDTYEETRQVCQILLDRVFRPCLENAPEYFEHMSRVMLEGVRNVLPVVDIPSMMYALRCLAEVPGYVYSEQDRMDFQTKLRKHQVNGKHRDLGVPSTALVQECAIEGLVKQPSRMHYVRDYDCIDNIPVYKQLPLLSKYKLAFNEMAVAFHATNIGRIMINWHLKWTLFIATYLPYRPLWNFGFKDVFVNIFKESPTDNEIPKPNSEYYKPHPPLPWYKEILSILW